MGDTKRMGKRDIDSALTYLRFNGYEIHPDPSATSNRFDIIWKWSTESVSPRDLWMIARGHRMAANAAGLEGGR